MRTPIQVPVKMGRKMLNIKGRRTLRYRCDHAELMTPIPAPVRGSFCQLCNVKKPEDAP